MDVLFARPVLSFSSCTGGFVPVTTGAAVEDRVIGDAETVVAMRYGAVAFSADIEEFEVEVAVAFMLDVDEPAWTKPYGALAAADTPEDVPLAMVGGEGAEPDMPVIVNMEV